MRQDMLVKDIDKMPLGDCIAVIKNKYTNTLRYVNCTIARLKPTKVIFIGAVPEELEEYKEILVRFDTPTSSYLKLKTCQTQQKEVQ